MNSADRWANRIAVYFAFLENWNLKPWEVDKMDTVLIQGLLLMKKTKTIEEIKEARSNAERFRR